MKRRNSKLISKNSSPITIPLPADFHRVLRAAAARSDSRANKDSSRKRKLSSEDVYDGNPSGFNIDDSLHGGGTQAPIYNGPKTSEYAFFKKLKTDSIQRFHSQSSNKEEYRSKKYSSSECREDGTKTVRKISNYAEGTNILRSSSRDFRPTSPTENFIHMDFERAAKNSKEIAMNKAFSPLEDTCSIEKWMGKDCDDIRSGGSHYEKTDIFSRKRQKLRQWVADCSFPEIYELCSKGNDFVSLLLSRLFPSSNEKNSSKIPVSWPMEINTQSKLLASPEQDIHFKKLHWMPLRNLAGFECMPSLENGPSSYWSDSLNEDIPSISDSPTCYAHSSFLQNNLGVPNCQLGGRQTISCIESESNIDFAIAEYESPRPSRHPLKEVQGFHDLNGFFLGREPPPARLLEWDFRNTTGEKSLAVACKNTDLMGNLSVISSQDHQEYLNNEFESFGARGLCASSILGNYLQTSCALLPSHSAKYQQYDYEFKEYILAENEARAADFNHLPLTLSCKGRYPYLTEDCNLCNGIDSFFSPKSHSWSIGNVSNEGNHIPGNESILSFELDLGKGFLSLYGSTREHHSSLYHVLEFPEKEIMSSDLITEDEHWSSLGGSSHRRNLNNFARDMIDIHGRPSFNFQLSLEKQKTCPLLLDNSSWEEPRGEKYNHDNEMHGFDASLAFGFGP